jgi:transcriptional regulator with XRE-family HTH domain
VAWFDLTTRSFPCQRLATVLRELREERGMMADELAKRIHYSRTKISRLENAYYGSSTSRSEVGG